MSSGSIIDSPNSSESLNVLTIGHKIYFEDVGIGSSVGNLHKSSAIEVGVTKASPSKKLKGVVQQPSRCQVEGCNVDLSDVKAYYSRHKVCIMHSKSTVVVVGGVQKRFCQQCSRFHQLPEFDQEKRSCRRRLAGHNERRRKPAPMSFLTSHYGSSSIFDTNNQGQGFLLDFSKNSEIPKSNDRTSALEVTGKFLMHPWTTNSYEKFENHSSSQYFHNTGFDPNLATGDYYSGGGGVVSDTSRALSLLSNEPWSSSKNPSLINHHNHNSAVANHIPSGSWSYNGNESAKMFSESDIGIGQLPQHVTNVYSIEDGVVQQDGRPELSSRFYESVQQMHWSL